MMRRRTVVVCGMALIVAEVHAATGGVGWGAAQLAAPTGLTAVVNGNSVLLQWVGSLTPVTSYVIEAGSYLGDPYTRTFDTGSTATSVTAVNVPSAHYWVWVRSRNGSELSALSNAVQVRVAGPGPCLDGDPPPPPTDWRALGQGSTVVLAWEPLRFGCPPTDYIIEAGSRSGATDLANYRTASDASAYAFPGVAPGTYYVRIRAAHYSEVSSPGFERMVIVGSNPCVYGVAPTAIGLSRSGLNGSLFITADPACPWSVSIDDPWLSISGGPTLVTSLSGTGSRSLRVGASAFLGIVRHATVSVRWPGGGVDLPATQFGFGAVTPF